MIIKMKKQLQGIALILVGIQLGIFAVIDPWLIILGGDLGRALIPIASLICSIVGLLLCFKSTKDS